MMNGTLNAAIMLTRECFMVVPQNGANFNCSPCSTVDLRYYACLRRIHGQNLKQLSNHQNTRLVSESGSVIRAYPSIYIQCYTICFHAFIKESMNRPHISVIAYSSLINFSIYLNSIACCNLPINATTTQCVTFHTHVHISPPPII